MMLAKTSDPEGWSIHAPPQALFFARVFFRSFSSIHSPSLVKYRLAQPQDLDTLHPHSLQWITSWRILHRLREIYHHTQPGMAGTVTVARIYWDQSLKASLKSHSLHFIIISKDDLSTKLRNHFWVISQLALKSNVIPSILLIFGLSGAFVILLVSITKLEYLQLFE